MQVQATHSQWTVKKRKKENLLKIKKNKNLEEVVYDISVWNVNSLTNLYSSQIIKMSSSHKCHACHFEVFKVSVEHRCVQASVSKCNKVHKNSATK